MTKKYTNNAAKALELAKKFASDFHHYSISSAHILLGVYEVQSGIGFAALSRQLPDFAELLEETEMIMGYGNYATTPASDYVFSPKSRVLLALANKEAENLDSDKIGTEHLLLAILAEPILATRILENLSVDINRLRKDIYRMLGKRPPVQQRRSNNKSAMLNGNKQKPEKKSVLEGLTKDLTAMARDGQLDKVVGRKFEVRRLLQVLSRRTKNNPVLVGEPGVGKTAIAEAVALMIAEGNVPHNLAKKRLLSLDMGSLVAGTKYRGEFEDRVKNMIAEIEEDGDVLLFIDELHTLIGAGGAEGAIDASNLLKPALARGKVQVIGATTLNEYQKYIEKDAALERRFAKVQVEEPSETETEAILMGIKEAYEDYHQVTITDEAIEAAVKFSERYISDRFLPDKAIDLMDEAAATKRLDYDVNHQNQTTNPASLEQQMETLEAEKLDAIQQQDYSKAGELHAKQMELSKQMSNEADDDTEKDQNAELAINSEDVAKVVSMWTQIPVSQMQLSETKQLVHLADDLHHRVKGQDEAVDAVTRAVKRSRSGIKNPNRPIGSFLFLGPTGVGKTELAKALAEQLFGSEKQLLRIDMSEYMEKYSVSRLVGSAPGYVGYDEGGQLTEKVRQHPYSVILFDEIEKAHPDVFNILLQIFDDGYVTDSKGRHVDFRNTVLIMTSNLGATALRDEKAVGFGATDVTDDYEAMNKRIRAEVKQTFKPEFINRVDEMIVFHSLQPEQVEEIVQKFIDNLVNQLAEKAIDLRVTAAAKREIANIGFSKEYGARPLRRVIQNQIEDPLSEWLIDGTISANDRVTVGVSKGQLYLKVVREDGTEYKEDVETMQKAEATLGV